MFPILFQLGTFRIYTYGIFLMLAFFWACFLIWKNIRISKFDEETAFDIVLTSFGGAFLIGRLVYVLFHLNEFGFDFLKFILINGYPGISPLGLIIGGIGTIYIMCNRRKIDFFEFIDYVVPSLFLFVSISKIGSFFDGSEIGIKTGAFRHPVALYSAILFFIGAFLANRILYAIRKESFSKEFPLLFFVWGYSFVVIMMNFLKDPLTLLTEIKAENWVFLTLLLTSCFYFVYYFRVLIGSGFKSFINWNIKYVQTVVKVVPRKSEKSDNGGGKENSTADRKH